MDNDESADILGGRLQVSPQRPALWADPGRITLLLGFATVVALAWVRLGPHYKHWQETRYRKAMRRRHGIPDDDHRPFNVAYAAALQARKAREGKSHGATQQTPQALSVEEVSQFPPSTDATAAYLDGPPLPLPAVLPPTFQNGYASVDLQPQSSSRYAPTYQNVAGPSTSQYSPLTYEHSSSVVPSSSGVRKSHSTTGRQSLATRTQNGKHALDDEADALPETLAKKSRVEDEELIDGDEEREWRDDEDGMDIDSSVHHGKRGSKRMASPEDDEGLAQSRAERRDKRARKVSLEKQADPSDDDMVEDELEDDLDYIHSAARGKKRDRAEAGSTFGGDDSLIDDDEKPHRQRRRRVVSNKLSQLSSRGQKRVRDIESLESDDSEVERPKREFTRKKRGKRSEEDIVPLSNDPLCKGRRIGEEWEANGIRFKVGPNGQRLRQELVKKSRTRFPMPSDSQHPDRRANVDVYVETWLTEEEYQSAKERHELAWQDAPPTPPESHTPGGVPESPSKAGKSLLWSSTMASRESPAKRGPLRQSITANAGLRLSMIAPSPVSSSRRISSVYQAPASPAADSPKLHKTKSYSKWEKQDLEAAAMSKIREKQLQQQQQLKAAPASAAPAPSLFGTPSATTTAPKASEKPAQSSAPSFGFTPGSTAAAASKPAAELPKLNVPGSTPAAASTEQAKPAAPSFPFPSSAGSSSAAAPAAAAKPDSQPSTSVPSFFSKPATAAPAPTAPAASNSTPSFFAKPPQASAPATANASTPTPAAAPTAPKAPFSFAPTPAATPSSTQPTSNSAQAPNGSAKTEESKPVPGGSLLARLGMGPPPAAQAPPASAFSFAKPTPAPASTTTSSASPFGTTANGASSSDNAPPKFSFGAPSKPANSTPAPAANGTSASSSTAAKPADTTTPKFSFGVNNSASQPSGSTTSTAAPSPFQSSATSAPSAPKSAFGFGGSSTSASNPFGGAASSSPFGAPSGTNTSASNPSPFGNAASASSTPASNPSPFGAPANGSAKPSEAPKSAFGFGNTSSTANASSSTPAEAPKSAFSFGNTTSSGSTSIFGGGASQNSSTAKTEAPKSTFSFGASSSSTPTFGATSSTPTFGAASSTPTFGASSSTPAFGATSTPSAAASGNKSAFSFANNSNNTSGTSSTPASGASTTESKPAFSFNFGTSNTSSGTGSAAPSPSAFGFGAQPSSNTSNTSTTPAASSPFGSAPAAQSGTNAFSFGASSGSFSFGSNAGQNTQK